MRLRRAGATETFAVTAEPGYLWLTNGPALIVGDARTSESLVRIRLYGRAEQGIPGRHRCGPGADRVHERDRREVRADDHPPPRSLRSDDGIVPLRRQLLSNQTFRDLFATETIALGRGSCRKRLALLFTDLQGSTALYDRIGDLKAFELVRQHFGVLRECIARNSGAFVKTIGDAVMACFVDPVDALRAALDMRARIARFNADAGNDLIILKVGVHAGACLAVTLNDRLDYFGQTVNIAARVQALAGANEIVVTNHVVTLPGAAELVTGLRTTSRDVELKGVAERVRVHCVREPL